MAAIAELDTSLQALRALKAPGVTKSRIKTITDLCVENIKQESVLVQKLFTNFKRTPSTHKLGVIYVVDAVTRQWIEHAMKSGQDVAAQGPPDGTFAAGVHRMTEFLPVLMNDLCASAPDDQKDKILKLIDIWERGNIFPSSMLSGFVQKLNARPKPAAQDTSQPVSQETSTNVQLLNQVAPQQQQTPGYGSQLPPPNGNLATNSLSNILPPTSQTVLQPSQSQSSQPDLIAQLRGIVPPEILSDTDKLTQYLQLLQQLQNMGVPQDQWSTVINVLDEQVSGRQQNSLAQALLAQTQPQSVPEPHRERSRSPVRRRDSPVYGTYRHRSPLRSGSPSLQQDKIPLGEPKWTEFDSTLPEGCIKVLSRTLFVGGVTCGEDELRSIFKRFGQVQTVIANTEKRHAFVKMVSRKEALAAKAGMEGNTENGRIRSTRWGVGFGPRDCSDYQTGISIVPIDRLTEADRRWVLTAEYGGTGGVPLAPGLVMEEPDIEIGAGVSSKAISARRFSPRKGDKEGGGGGGGGKERGGRRDKDRQSDEKQAQKTQHDNSDRGRSGGGSNNNSNQRGYSSNASMPQIFQNNTPLQQQYQQIPPQQQQQQYQPQQSYTQYQPQNPPQQQQSRQNFENSLGVPPAVPGFGLQLPGIGGHGGGGGGGGGVGQGGGLGGLYR